jgi:protein involved in polysaccharide export with SLBB domain
MIRRRADTEAATSFLWDAQQIIAVFKNLFLLRSMVALVAACAWLIALDGFAQEPGSGEAFDNAYKLGPGDQILIDVFGEEELSMDFSINDTGTLNYPFLGELKVEGLSVIELERLITRGLKGPFLVDPDVTVSVKEYRFFYLRGEVQQPGGIPYRPGLTLDRAISLGGGFTPRAAKKKVKVLRATEPNAEAKPIAPNEPVYPGDVIFVAERFF